MSHTLTPRGDGSALPATLLERRLEPAGGRRRQIQRETRVVPATPKLRARERKRIPADSAATAKRARYRTGTRGVPASPCLDRNGLVASLLRPRAPPTLPGATVPA